MRSRRLVRTPPNAEMDVHKCPSADAPPSFLCAIASVARDWRTQVLSLRAWGASAQANVLEHAAEQLEQAIADEGRTILTLHEAAAESGYSAEHLARLIRHGKIPNVGRRHAPRVRRGDLPRKPHVLPDTQDLDIIRESNQDLARAIVSSRS